MRISPFQLPRLGSIVNRGFFNVLNHATIKNLTIEGSGFNSIPSGAYGGALLVGIANDSVISNCVVKGGFSSATDNLACIAVRIKNTTMKDCKSHANLTGRGGKVGGVVAVCEGNSNVIENCVNEGTLTVEFGKHAGFDGLSGIVGCMEEGSEVTIRNFTNEGGLVKGQNAHTEAKIGQFVGWAKPKSTVTLEGGNTVRADTLAVWRSGPMPMRPRPVVPPRRMALSQLENRSDLFSN